MEWFCKDDNSKCNSKHQLESINSLLMLVPCDSHSRFFISLAGSPSTLALTTEVMTALPFCPSVILLFSFNTDAFGTSEISEEERRGGGSVQPNNVVQQSKGTRWESQGRAAQSINVRTESRTNSVPATKKREVLIFYFLSDEFFVFGYTDECYLSVQFVGCILIFIAFTMHSNPNTEWHIANPFAPNKFI